MGWSPAQGILPIVLRLRNWKKQSGSKLSCRGITRSSEHYVKLLTTLAQYYSFLCRFISLRPNKFHMHIKQRVKYNAGSEILTAMVTKSIIFRDITPYSPLKQSPVCHLLSRWCLGWYIRPWRWRQYIPPKLWLTSNLLHVVISQIILLFG
jgi:hypothetical protein